MKCILKWVHNETIYIHNIIHNNTVDIKFSLQSIFTFYRLRRTCHPSLETETVHALSECRPDAGSWVCLSHLGRVWQLTGRIGRTIRKPMWHRSAVGQLSSLSSRTKWQRLPAANTPHTVSPAGNRCHFVLLDKNESCPTPDLCHIGCPMVRPMACICWTHLTGRILPAHESRGRVELFFNSNFINIMHMHEAFLFFSYFKKLPCFSLHADCLSLMKIYSMHELFFSSCRFLSITGTYKYNIQCPAVMVYSSQHMFPWACW